MDPQGNSDVSLSSWYRRMPLDGAWYLSRSASLKEGGLEPVLFPGLRCGLTQEVLPMLYVLSITSSDIFGLRIAVCAWPSLI